MVGSLEASPVLGGRRRRIKFLFLFSGNLIYHVEQGNIISSVFDVSSNGTVTVQQSNIYLFCRTKREFFFQKSTLGYMTKTLNPIFFFLHQNQNIFFSNIGNQNIFLESFYQSDFKLSNRFPTPCTLYSIWNPIGTLPSHIIINTN
jgi:hypothetical protein